MLKSTIHTRGEPISPSSSIKLNSISPRKSNSQISKLKPISTSKPNLKKLEITEHFLPISPRTENQEGSFSHSLRGFHPIQSVHLSPREFSLSKIMKTEPNRSQTLEKIDKNMALTVKDFGQVSLSPRSGQEQGQLSLRSPKRLISISSKRELDSSSLDESKILSLNFSKFNNYLVSLKKSESRKSPLAKETFYYPDQLEVNKRFDRLGREMKLIDEKGLFHFRTIREGKKERIKLPIGTKTYMKINCEGKTFPLNVKVETKLGTFQIFVSKNNERPDRENCDFYFSQAYFEIMYSDPQKIRYLYFHVLGTGNMELNITMNFSDRAEIKNSSLVKTHAFGHKGVVSATKYEIFHEYMTRDEERDFKEIIEEIKRERAQRAQQNRDIITDNLSLAGEFPKIKKEQQAEQIQKRDFALFKNREKRAHLVQRKKLQQTCDLLKPDVKRLAKSWRMKKEAEIQQTITFQKSWFILATLCFLGMEIRQKKRDIIAWRVITRIKEHAALRLQRMVRNYLSRPLEIKGKDLEDEKTTDQHQELTMLNIFNGMNSAVLQWRAIQKQKAEKILVSFFEDLTFAVKINKAVIKYSTKVGKIQKKWKQKIEVINTRVDIFLTCWNEYCGLLLSETKAKSKLLAAFASIKEQHIREKGKKFVKGRIGSMKSMGTMGTMQYIIETFKGQNAISKISPSIVPSLANEKSLASLQKGALRRGSKLAARGSLLHLTKESISDLQSQPKSKFIPSLAELKDIFDTIINDIQREESSK